jgi:hypothetical protein
MSTPHRQQPDESGWVSLEEGIPFSRRWLAERTPRLHKALQRARDEEQRRAIALRILRAAADAESETPASAKEPGPAHEWDAVAERIEPRLTHGSDWPLLAIALTRAAAAGYDVEAKLPGLAAASPLPERHPARELQWRLIGDCSAAVPELPPRRPVDPTPRSAPESAPPPATARPAQRAGPDR